MKKRVVITGTGAICSIGNSTASLWESCMEQKVSIQEIPQRWKALSKFNSRFWSPLGPLPKDSFFQLRTDAFQLDKCQIMTIATAMEAIRDSKLEYIRVNGKCGICKLKDIDTSRTGIFIGTGAGGIGSMLSAHSYHNLSPLKSQLDPHKYGFADAFPLRFNPFTVPMMMLNGSADILGIRLSISGINRTICAACASGTMAIGEAYKAVSSGKIDVAIAGGVEYLNDPSGGVFRSFDTAGVLTKGDNAETCNAPFDQNRSGFLFSEGGCALMVIESLEHALNRGTNIIAEIKAYFENFEAYNLMMMEPEGKFIEELLISLLDKADLDKSEIDYINAHGTGTVANDQIESMVIKKIFGTAVSVNSTKSLTGHILGASGAIEAVITALSVQKNTIHASKNIFNPVNDINLIKKSTHTRIRNAITESFSFGGHNAALVLGKV